MQILFYSNLLCFSHLILPGSFKIEIMEFPFLLSLWKLTNKTRWRKFPVIFYQNNRNKISSKLVSNLIRNAFDFIMKLRGLAFPYQGMKFPHQGMKFLYQEMKLFWKYRLSNGFISVIPQSGNRLISIIPLLRNEFVSVI